MPKSIAGEVALQYCNDWPDVPSMTLAKKMYAENRVVFTNLEHARAKIRVYRGQSGKAHRKDIKANENFKELTYTYNPMDLPESYAESYDPILIQQSKTLSLSDIHFPYQDNKALDTAINFGIKKGVTCILLNGDSIDMHFQSKYEKDARKRKPFEEFASVRQFLELLKKTFPSTRIIYKLGNHDERWEKWLYVQAPILFGDPEFTIEGRLKLGELGIEVIKDKLPVKIGKLWVLHGHELQGGGGVNPARATFNKTMASVLIGHCHRTSTHTEPTMNGDVIVTNSQGCLCGLYPDFARINKWNHGFSYIESDIQTGEYRLENLKIINGKVY